MNADESKPEEYSWPVAGDKLFADGTDWRSNACLKFAFNKWDAYATGYKDAADIIVKRVVETREGMDTLIYPVAFLYRHYLEVRLKEIIIYGRDLVDEPSDLERIHHIDILWKSARELLEKIWPKGSKIDLDTVGDCIDELSRSDSSSQGFRYPYEANGKPTLSDMEQVNLPHFSEVMGRISSLLDSASTGISEFLAGKRSDHEENYE